MIRIYQNLCEVGLLNNSEKEELSTFVEQIKNDEFNTKNISTVARFLDLLFEGTKDILTDEENEVTFYYDEVTSEFYRIYTDLELQTVLEKYFV